MSAKPFHPQVTMSRTAKALTMGIVCLGFSFLASKCFGASLKKVTGTPGESAYDSAINQNFDRINNELSNTVHKTSTETIVGYKYFTSPVDFGTVTADTGTIGNLTASTLTVNTSASFNVDIDMNSHKITELTNGSASSDAAAFGQIPTVATQAEQETGTSNTVFVSPGRQRHHVTASKAWIRFNGSGTVAINASYNVSSITDNGTGDYTINFSTAFSTANYAMAGMGRRPVSTPDAIVCLHRSADPTASACRIATTNGNGTHEDFDIVSAIFFGDQ